MPLLHHRLCEILVFILLLISACRRMSSGLSQVALLSYVSCAAFVEMFCRLSISRWLLSLSYHGLITARRHWLASWTACLTVSSLSSMQQLGQSLVFVARSILQMLSLVFTGCGHPSASSSNWRSLSTELFTALHLSTCWTGCSTSLICRRDVEAGCDHRPPVSSTSARRGMSLLAIALLLLVTHDSGTVYLLMSSLPRYSQHFARSSKHIYFGNPTQTLSFSCVAIVVLEVTFTLATIKSFKVT